MQLIFSQSAWGRKDSIFSIELWACGWWAWVIPHFWGMKSPVNTDSWEPDRSLKLDLEDSGWPLPVPVNAPSLLHFPCPQAFRETSVVLERYGRQCLLHRVRGGTSVVITSQLQLWKKEAKRFTYSMCELVVTEAPRIAARNVVSKADPWQTHQWGTGVMTVGMYKEI